jgi:hypothetical protein
LDIVSRGYFDFFARDFFPSNSERPITPGRSGGAGSENPAASM